MKIRIDSITHNVEGNRRLSVRFSTVIQVKKHIVIIQKN